MREDEIIKRIMSKAVKAGWDQENGYYRYWKPALLLKDKSYCRMVLTKGFADAFWGSDGTEMRTKFSKMDEDDRLKFLEQFVRN